MREKTLEELRKAAKQGAFGEFIGTVAELRPQVAVAEKKAEERRSQLSAFRVHESYDELSSKAASRKEQDAVISSWNSDGTGDN